MASTYLRVITLMLIQTMKAQTTILLMLRERKVLPTKISNRGFLSQTACKTKKNVYEMRLCQLIFLISL
jgi:hypothetical protein